MTSSDLAKNYEISLNTFIGQELNDYGFKGGGKDTHVSGFISSEIKNSDLAINYFRTSFDRYIKKTVKKNR